MKQSTALHILKTGKNVFLTGSAGSGKTYVLNQYIHYLRARDISVAVTASTGIASTHMNGMTIHSWSGIGILDELTNKDIARIKKRNIVCERIQKTQVLIIDEISMLHRKQLDMINEILQVIRADARPFGGLQLILAGDFFQLPPVGKPNETNREKFAFMSKAWLDADLQICYLNEQHRQKQQQHPEDCYYGLDLTAILNQIRRQEFTEQILPALLATKQHQLSLSRTRLYTHNIDVNKINEQELNALTTPSISYHGFMEGDATMAETLKKSVRNSPELTLKIGAKVMFIKNSADLNVSNGTMGTIIDFIEPQNQQLKEHQDNNQKEKMPLVLLNDGRKVIVSYDVWQIDDENGEPLATYYHIPLTLAWAITIHKSQGMTLDAAEIDLSHTFENGQGYVALSRLQRLSGLKLLGINELSLALDPLARGADYRFLALSEQAESQFFQQSMQNIQQQQRDFIISRGGSLNQQKIADYEKRQQKQQQNLQRKAQLHQLNKDDNVTLTLLETKKLLEESLTIAEISEIRQLAQATIMGHIELLLSHYPDLSIEHIRPDDDWLKPVAKAYQQVKKANRDEDKTETGKFKIRPIYERLTGYSYNDIRLALLFIKDKP